MVIHEIQLRVQQHLQDWPSESKCFEGDRGPGEAYPRPDHGHSIGRQSQTARRPLPAVQAEKANQGIRRSRSRARASGLPNLDSRRNTHRSGRGRTGTSKSAEKGIDSVEKVLEGVGHILAEAISEMATVRDGVRKVVWKTGKIVTSKAELPEGQGLEYRDYFDYSEPAAQIPPHRILAINRGEKEGPLKVRIDVSRPDLEAVLFSQLPLEGHPQADLFRAAGIDALDRLILPSMEREVRRDLVGSPRSMPSRSSAKNLRGLLLLQPPDRETGRPGHRPWVSGQAAGWPCRPEQQPGRPGGDLPAPTQNRRSEAKIAAPKTLSASTRSVSSRSAMAQPVARLRN